jgi:hypothetical protein
MDYVKSAEISANRIIIIAAAAISVLTVIICLVLILIRRHKPQAGDLLIVRETYMSWVFGLALWFEVAIILYYVFVMPERLLVNANSYINTSVFMLAGAVTGSAAMLNYFVKCTVVREKELTDISLLGRQKTLKWVQIKSVSVYMGRRLILVSKENTTIKVGGEPKSFRKFLRLAAEKLPKGIDRKPLGKFI